MGLAQAQANNSNNKTATYTGYALCASDNLPEDLQRLMEDWAQEVLIVTHRPGTDSLSISGQQLWDHVVPQTQEQLANASNVSFMQVINQFVFNCLFTIVSKWNQQQLLLDRN